MASKRTPRKSARAKRATTRKASRARTTRRNDIITDLTNDHDRLKALFRKFGRMKDGNAQAARIVQEACRELEIHTALEERVFYPAVRDEIRQELLIDEAEVEHESARRLMADLQRLEPRDPRYAATFRVLMEHVGNHIEAEERRIFPQVRRARIDRAAMAEKARTMRQELMSAREREPAIAPPPRELGQRPRGETRQREPIRH